jgi:hypothetical protein
MFKSAPTPEIDGGEMRRLRCTCDTPSEFNRQDVLGYDRHQPKCDLAPNVATWFWYPHDGELEEGGVYVNPADFSCVYLLVGGYLCRAPRAALRIP